jgi:protein SCO1/2
MLVAVRFAVTCLAAAAALVFGVVWAGQHWPDSWAGHLVGGGATHAAAAGAQDQPAAALAQLSIGGPFDLVGPSGQKVTEASYPGRWKLIYFGYTTCPDACPTTLQTIAATLKALGPQAARVAPLFITVDPARDRPDVLAHYTALFDPRIVGLTGSPRQVTRAETSFRVYAARVDQPGTNTYLMDHTSFIYLLDPQGRLQALFDLGTTAATMTARLREKLA